MRRRRAPWLALLAAKPSDGGVGRCRTRRFGASLLIAVGAALLAAPSTFAQTRTSAPDRTFGDDGVASTSLGSAGDQSYPQGLVRQPDGKLVVLTSLSRAGDNYRPVLTRFTPQGAVDRTFGSNGSVSLEDPPLRRGVWRGASALAMLPDGGLIVGGPIAYENPELAEVVHGAGYATLSAAGARTNFVTMRPARNSFSTGDVYPEDIADVDVAPSGAFAYGGAARFFCTLDWDQRHRCEFENGTSFGWRGRSGRGYEAIHPVRNHSRYPYNIDVKAVLARASFDSDHQLVQYWNDHQGYEWFDVSSHGVDGPNVERGDGTRGTDLVLLPGGQTLATGYQRFGPPGAPTASPRILFARYEANTTFDQSFGQGGVHVTSVEGVPTDLALQSSGRLIVAEFSRLLGFNQDGTPDRSFGEGGEARLDGSTAGTKDTMVIQPDDKIVLAMLCEGCVKLIRVGASAGGTSAIAASVRAKRRQRGTTVKTRVACELPCTAAGRGAATAKGGTRTSAAQATVAGRRALRVKLRSRRKQIAAGERTILKLRPKGKKATRQLTRALRRGAKATARVRITVSDQQGNSKTDRLRVMLRR